MNYSYNGKRRKEYLGIILDAPTSAERRAENRNKVLIARQIRAKKELEFLSVEYHLNDIENTFDDILPTDKSNVPDFYILIGQYLEVLFGFYRVSLLTLAIRDLYCVVLRSVTYC